MKIKRIVPNIAACDIEAAKRFYGEILGLPLAMDLGWIATFEVDTSMRPQLSIAVHGGSNTAVPDLSIEVDDLDAAVRLFEEANVAIEYGPVDEPWGVRRFYVRDPFGRLLNILTHVD
jgi:catechol 2,3-dioxygenase-like lactoylglutathione lyase family enzyme